jgi:hypothetical protein
VRRDVDVDDDDDDDRIVSTMSRYMGNFAKPENAIKRAVRATTRPDARGRSIDRSRAHPEWGLSGASRFTAGTSAVRDEGGRTRRRYRATRRRMG